MRLVIFILGLFIFLQCRVEAPPLNDLWYSKSTNSFIYIDNQEVTYYPSFCLESEKWKLNTRNKSFESESIQLAACRRNPNKKHTLSINYHFAKEGLVMESRDTCFRMIYDVTNPLKFAKNVYKDILEKFEDYTHLVIKTKSSTGKEIVIEREEIASFDKNYLRTVNQILSTEEQVLLFIQALNDKPDNAKIQESINQYKLELYQGNLLLAETYYSKPRCQFEEMGNLIYNYSNRN